ncbi:unnamed protein product [Cyclocybe aegerita]|uniref:F-box domain-containing protein n=1 Tax=Cyclocybe aegerita TaxID=1973307 RepID=A0A8S0WVE5_CYCAE|nr:unnamed protein product [Cyclocybe aegerita]
MSSSLTSLPEELLIDIMTHLDSHSILQMALTCRAFYGAFQSTPIRYIYELGINSMRDAGSGKSTDELLVLLRDRQKAWATLEWKSFTTVELPPNQQSFKQSAGLLAELDMTDLLVIYLPSPTQPCRTIRHSIEGMQIYDFAIDGNQDLVILAGYFELLDKRRIRLHCRTISTNEVHPNATPGGILEFDIREDECRERYSVVMQITLADDVVAFWRYGQGGQTPFLLWNWTAGLLLFNSFEDRLPDCPPNLSFDLLLRDAFLLTSATSSGQILIYRFSPTVPGMPVHVASLGLPPTAPPACVTYIRPNSGQFQPRSTPGMLFMHLPESRIHIFSVNYYRHRYTLFVRSSTFLRYVDDSASEAQDVPWEMWGERESRFTEVDLNVWSRKIHGSRVIHGLSEGASINVLDFLSALPCLASANCERHGSDNPTVVPRKQLFLQDVVTRLPYRVVSKVIDAKPSMYWIDEERIIALDVASIYLASTMPSSFPSLPQELLIEIMNRLDSHSILQMALTCRCFYAIFQSTPIRYIYELGMNSLQDAGSGMPTDELLVLLRDRQKAWATLEWKSLTTVKVPPSRKDFERSAGAMARLDRNLNELLVVYLPTSTQPSRAICYLVPGIKIHNFAIDASRDLVVMTESSHVPGICKWYINLHCRTISTNEVHPNATLGGILEFDIDQHKKSERDLMSSRHRILLVDDVLALCAEIFDPILLWNWTTGLLLFNSGDHVSLDWRGNIQGFEFLRRDTFILTSAASSGQILVCRFSPTTPGTPIQIISFGLPPTAPPVFRPLIQCGYGHFEPRPMPGMLFTHLPESRMLCFSLIYIHRCYWLYVCSSTFLRYADESEAGVGEVHDVPWEFWGERGSRFMDGDPPYESCPHAHGSRVVSILPDSSRIQVLDFSSTRPCLASPICRRYGAGDPTIVTYKGVFAKDVVTRLPYWAVSRVMEEGSFNYMIDEEHIIAFPLDAGVAAPDVHPDPLDLDSRTQCVEMPPATLPPELKLLVVQHAAHDPDRIDRIKTLGALLAPSARKNPSSGKLCLYTFF